MAVEQKEGMRRTVVVTLVLAVGGAPLWKESAVFCMAGSLTPVRGDVKMWDGTVAGGVVEERGKGGRMATRRAASRESRRESLVDVRHLVSPSCSVLVRIRGQFDEDQFLFPSLQYHRFE